MNEAPDRLRHAISSQVGVQVLKLILAIGLSGWLSRYLGPTRLGQLSYATALVGLVAPLGSLGIPGSLSALLCETPPIAGLVPTALIIELVGTAIIALVVFPFAFFSQDKILASLVALAVLGNLFSSTEVLETELLIRQRGTVLARIGLFQVTATAALTSLAITVQAPLIVFGLLQVLQAFLRAFCLILVRSSQRLLRQFHQINLNTAITLAKRGLPLLIAGLSVSLYMKSDQVMLQWLKGSDAVGQYSVAARISESLYFVPVLLSSTYFSRIGMATSAQASSHELKRLYQYSWLFGIGMLIANIFILPPTIPYIFGPRFEQAQLTLACSSVATFAVAMGCASSCWLQLMKLEWIATARTILGAAVNIALNAVLIPRFGAAGAAIATSSSYLIATFAFTLIFSSQTRHNTLVLMYPFA